MADMLEAMLSTDAGRTIAENMTTGVLVARVVEPVASSFARGERSPAELVRALASGVVRSGLLGDTTPTQKKSK